MICLSITCLQHKSTVFSQGKLCKHHKLIIGYYQRFSTLVHVLNFGNNRSVYPFNIWNHMIANSISRNATFFFQMIMNWSILTECTTKYDIRVWYVSRNKLILLLLCFPSKLFINLIQSTAALLASGCTNLSNQMESLQLINLFHAFRNDSALMIPFTNTQAWELIAFVSLSSSIQNKKL